MAKYKTMYHSGLIQNSPMHIQITSDTVKSKYPVKADGSGEFFVTFNFNGIEYAYTSENSATAQFLGRFKGQNITISAAGKKNEAVINLLGVDGSIKESSNSVLSNASAPSAHPVAASATPASSKDGNIAFGEALQKVTDAHFKIKKAVLAEFEISKLAGFTTTPEFFQAECMSAFIYLDRKGLI